MTLIDTHCHLDFSVFNKDRGQLIEDAQKEGVSTIIVPAVSQENWESVSKIEKKYDLVKVAYGLHPMFINKHRKSDISRLKKQLVKKEVVAVGECGLDFYIQQANKEAQIEIFVEQLKLASEFSLPVIIHARKSLDIVLKYLRQYPDLTGIIHSFSGSYQQAKICIEQGFLLGFGGPVTYTRATKLRKLVKELPLEGLVLETDAPSQPDSLHYGQRNVPANLRGIAKEVAELRKCDLTEVMKVTTQNSSELFKLK